ncbi:MAG TPA: hypothetical protein VMT43_06230 [Acidimicrobiales bacterium]|nr:hypothetical protein [Acidimicrobiales bacterium]
MTRDHPSKAARRLRALAMAAVVTGVVAAVRRALLDRDQRAFELRYGPSSDGSTPS